MVPQALVNAPVLQSFFSHTDPNLPHRASIGWQRQEQPSYSWRGLERPDGPTAIFQYTLAGRGVLERRGVQYTLEPGQAFLVEVPDDHHYYLPAGWPPWEFVFITFDGADVLRHVRWVIKQHGSILALTDEHPVIEILFALATAIDEQHVPDVEAFAEYLYRFTLALRRVVAHPQMTPCLPIARALQYAARHYADAIGVDELARAAGLSRAHFSRLFHREMSISPLHYLIGIRLQRASSLLRGTPLPLEEIAVQCGFAGASYFGKVFLRATGITPRTYRRGEAPRTDPTMLCQPARANSFVE